MNGVVGRINSFQSLGAVDGPGVRYVVFMQGCPLSCGYCHNPETKAMTAPYEMTAGEVFERVLKYKSYFGKEGGITVSGGEPLMQIDFVKELFALCKKNGISTCLDTSGIISDERVRELLEVTDICLLDIKMTDEKSYQEYIGCSISQPLSFLELLDESKVRTWIRQVIVSPLNDSRENITALKSLVKPYSCVEKIQLLPFRKICKAKYDSLGLEFSFECYEEPKKEIIEALNDLLSSL